MLLKLLGDTPDAPGQLFLAPGKGAQVGELLLGILHAKTSSGK